MKQKIAFILTLIAAFSIFIACNNSDDNSGPNPILGTWKLVEAYSNGSPISLNSCDMEETWIFGPEQFTHELYENGGKPGKTAKSVNETQDDSDEDSDDESSDDEEESDDENSDDEGSDDTTDDSTDDSTDDTTDDTPPTTDDSSDDSDDDNGGGGSGTCVVSDMFIGNWTSHNNNYTLTVDGVSEVKTVTFTDSNNRFYIETTVTVNGVAVTRRYVYQKQ